MVLAEVLLVAAGVLLVWVALLNVAALRMLRNSARCPFLNTPRHSGVVTESPPEPPLEAVHVAPSDAAIEARNFDGALGGPLP
jgi:sulfite exporter TauE/SafE